VAPVVVSIALYLPAGIAWFAWFVWSTGRLGQRLDAAADTDEALSIRRHWWVSAAAWATLANAWGLGVGAFIILRDPNSMLPRATVIADFGVLFVASIPVVLAGMWLAARLLFRITVAVPAGTRARIALSNALFRPKRLKETSPAEDNVEGEPEVAPEGDEAQEAESFGAFDGEAPDVEAEDASAGAEGADVVGPRTAARAAKKAAAKEAKAAKKSEKAAKRAAIAAEKRAKKGPPSQADEHEQMDEPFFDDPSEDDDA
jgi:hypothetical protein